MADDETCTTLIISLQVLDGAIRRRTSARYAFRDERHVDGTSVHSKVDTAWLIIARYQLKGREPDWYMRKPKRRQEDKRVWPPPKVSSCCRLMKQYS